MSTSKANQLIHELSRPATNEIMTKFLKATDSPSLMKCDGGLPILPDGSSFFVADIDADRTPDHPIKWNPFNKVVQDHRDGTIIQPDTDIERAKRGLPVPWMPVMADIEVHESPIS